MESLVAFVAYASADGFDFASTLVAWLDRRNPPVTAWIDRDNPPDAPFDTRIENAIIGAHVVLLVLTDAAAADNSWARKELMMAEAWRTPIMVLRPPGTRADLPITAQVAADIDLSPAKGGWKRLDHELRLLRPANDTIRELTALRDELEERASRCNGAERNALRAQAGLLLAFIQQEHRRAGDPASTAEEVRQLISDGQHQDAVGQTFAVPADSFRIVDGPPAMSGAGVHDRDDERRLLLEHLRDPKIRLVTVRGPAGSGKTTLLTDLIPRLEAFGYAGVAYVSTHGPRRVTPDLLLEKLALTHPDAGASGRLRERLEDRSFNWHQNLQAALDAFGERPVLLIIDNAEELLDGGQLTDPHLREFAYTVASQSDHGVRLLLATRTDGRRIADISDGTRQVDIPPGLPPHHAAAFIRDLDPAGIARLNRATEATLRRIHRLTGGHPRTMELLYAVLRGEPAPDPEQVLTSATASSMDNDDGSSYLIRRATAALNGPVRRVLQALAIYGRPVRPSAVSWLLAPYDTGLDSTAALRLLGDRRLVRCDGDLYYLPLGAEATAVVETIPLGRPQDRDSQRPRFTRYALLHRAAEYFRGVHQLEVRVVQEINDLAAQFSEVDLRLAGGQYVEAAKLVKAIDHQHLLQWGYRSLVMRQREHLVGRLGRGRAEIGNRHELAAIYLQASRPDDAIAVLHGADELAVAIRADGDVAIRLLLAAAHYTRGELREAKSRYEAILQRGVHRTLVGCRIGLALCLNELGQVDQAHDQYAAALEVVDDASVEASALLNLGLIQQNLGRPLAALRSIGRARGLAHECSDALLSVKCVDATAYVLMDTGQLGRARRLADAAIKAASDTENADLCRETYSTLALILLLGGDVDGAHAAADAATRFFHNRRPLAALALLGITQLRRGERHMAELSFRRAKHEVDRLLDIEPQAVQVLDISGLVLTGLAQTDTSEDLAAAVAAYRQARERTHAPGVVLRAVRLVDELLNDDTSQQAQEVRDAAGGVSPR